VVAAHSVNGDGGEHRGQAGILDVSDDGRQTKGERCVTYK
jgi:hypothetical protein